MDSHPHAPGYITNDLVAGHRITAAGHLDQGIVQPPDFDRDFTGFLFLFRGLERGLIQDKGFTDQHVSGVVDDLA